MSVTLPVGVSASRTDPVAAPVTQRITRTTYAPDPLMRTKTVRAPGQAVSSTVRYGKGDLTRVSHENRFETVTDELGKSVTSHFDRWGQLAIAIADSGGTHETTTRFEYDGLGRLISSTAPIGRRDDLRLRRPRRHDSESAARRRHCHEVQATTGSTTCASPRTRSRPQTAG